MSPGEDQLSRRPSSQLMGCVMLGNFTPVRDLLCALWRERESERAALPPTARDSKKGGKKHSQQATSPAERNSVGFPRWETDIRVVFLYVRGLLRVEEFAQVSFRCFVSGKKRGAQFCPSWGPGTLLTLGAGTMDRVSAGNSLLEPGRAHTWGL